MWSPSSVSVFWQQRLMWSGVRAATCKKDFFVFSPLVAKVEKSAGSWRHMPQYQTGSEVRFHYKTDEFTTQGTELR
jgi:hypothetical protein